jgi:hypothetical protein
MLDKFLTGENVKANGEIAGRRHILRTLGRTFNTFKSRRLFWKSRWRTVSKASLKHLGRGSVDRQGPQKL